MQAFYLVIKICFQLCSKITFCWKLSFCTRRPSKYLILKVLVLIFCMMTVFKQQRISQFDHVRKEKVYNRAHCSRFQVKLEYAIYICCYLIFKKVKRICQTAAELSGIATTQCRQQRYQKTLRVFSRRPIHYWSL